MKTNAHGGRYEGDYVIDQIFALSSIYYLLFGESIKDISECLKCRTQNL